MSYLSICKHITLFQYHFLYLCSGGFDFDIMNKIVADGVDRHLVNVEERRIMSDKNIMKKRQGTLGRGFDRCDFYFYMDK